MFDFAKDTLFECVNGTNVLLYSHLLHLKAKSLDWKVKDVLKVVLLNLKEPVNHVICH